MAHLHEMRDADSHFTIDGTTMVITNPNTSKNKLRVGDHSSEIFTFEIPRYVENHDMLLCNKIGIHYLDAGANKVDVSKDVYWVEDAAVSEDNPDVIVFSWTISGNATKYAGMLSWGIMFGCLEDDGITYSYVKNTEIFSGITISDGYNFTEAVAAEYADVLEKWKKELVDAGTLTEEDIKNAVDGYLQENPITIQPLTFTGAVEAEYNGSEPVTVNIPSGGGGGGESTFRLINTVNITEEVSTITIDKDGDGNAFEISEVLIYFDTTTYATASANFYFRPLCRAIYNMLCYGFINTTAGDNFHRWIYAKHIANGFWRAEFVMNTDHKVPLYSNPGETITSFELTGQTLAAGNIYVYGR